MQCYVCDKEDFHYREDLNPKNKVAICKDCGNVMFYYESIEKENQRLNDLYETEYRKNINIMNIVTCNRKLKIIMMFLSEFLKDKKDLICCDIGCATGYLVKQLRLLGHKSTGTEYTLEMRRLAEHFYGIPITKEIEKKHKYDLITMFHTLEHMIQPDKKLMEYRECLSDNGVLMISVPEWFFILENLAGIGDMTTPNYFHEWHINCFSRKSFKNLLKKVGLEIIKEDNLAYGMTVLVKKAEPLLDFEKEDWQAVNKNIDKIKRAVELFKEGKPKDALDVWGLFPEADIRIIFELNRKDPSKQEHLWIEVLKKYEQSKEIRIKISYGIWLYQNERHAEAVTVFNEVVNIRPSEDIFVYIGWSLFALKNYQQAMQAFAIANEINPQKWSEVYNWILKCAISMPNWEEIAIEQMKNQLFEKNKPEAKLKETFM